jgi:Na+/proline symporter/signal transduction histidine kinase
VGTAASTGFDYLAIYLGPCLVFMFGYPMVSRMIMICKSSNITSVSDFIASRYGKSRSIAILVTLIAVIGSIPYIALQLKAIAMSFSVLTSGQTSHISLPTDFFNDTGFYVTLVLAVFTILFGTRHLDATEHHQGLILAISFESIVKLLAILAVGYYTVFLLLDFSSSNNIGFSENGIAKESVARILKEGSSTWQSFLTKTLLAMSAIILLPRQFHVAIVEARDHKQFKTATWVMPIYLILTSIIVVPIAISGILIMPEGQVDLYVLSLPLTNGNETLAMIAFIGGSSAATGMVIVAAISLSTMISNDWVMPALLRWKDIDILKRQDLTRLILLIRRVAIIVLLMLGYGYYGLLDNNERLANIGLVSFAAIAQFLPAVISAMYWKRAHRKGVFWGLIAGVVVWAYCLLMPTLVSEEALAGIFAQGSWIHPQSLLGYNLSDSLTHGVFWSLLVNASLMVFFSLRNKQGVVEQFQANFFINPLAVKVAPVVNLTGADVDRMSAMELKSAMNLDEFPRVPVTVQAIQAVSERIIGVKNSNTLLKQFSERNEHFGDMDVVADTRLLSQVYAAIAGVIGGSSAQRVMTEQLLGGEEFLDQATFGVDDASTLLKFNRNLMQTTLENISQGISVVDQDLNLVIWNGRYLELFEYPENLIYSGMPVLDLLEFNARRGEFPEEKDKSAIKKRIQHLINKTTYEHVSTRKNGRVIKHMGEPMQGGGYVTTYQDITDTVLAAQMLREANEELENRVRERTLELEALTVQLKKATQSKTHFLAAASHDLLQPINAARLFSHSIRQYKSDESQVEKLAANVEQSLSNANELLSALLDISKFDAEGIQPEVSCFRALELIVDIRLEFEERAENKGVEIVTVATSSAVETDRRLLFSVLQNFISNAVRYTLKGDKILLGVRHRVINGEKFLEIQVLDSGVGINEDKMGKITQEFYRIQHKELKDNSRGLGLGLSIVQRIADLLKAPLCFESEFARGSLFSITVPSCLEDIQSIQSTYNEDMFEPKESLQGLTIVCLDNDEAVLESLMSVLEYWGCEVLPANNYDLAAEFMSDDVDVVLADFHLDDENERTGAHFLEHQLTDYRAHGVLITAARDQGLDEAMEELGFDYLRKPVDIDALKRLLSKIVDEAS